MTDQPLAATVAPADVSEWLARHGWQSTGQLEGIASRWERDDRGLVVPLRRDAPDFVLRWREMLTALAGALDTDVDGALLAVTKAGSDIAEFRAVGPSTIDDSMPLGDASAFIESVRRAVQASANSTLQPRSYFGHSLPDAARDHARNVRMGQTRRGSYIVPVISRVPVLEPEDTDDALLFTDATYQPFARSAMLRLAEGLATLRELTHGQHVPATSTVVASIGAGVSSELCDAVATVLETTSVDQLDVAFTWAERLPRAEAAPAVVMEGMAAPVMRLVSGVLKGEAVIGRQTFIGYVKGLDRGEDDEIGRITLRALDNDRARNITMDLNDSDYHVASEANAERRMVSVTGVLHREPGRALKFTDVADLHLLEELPNLMPEGN